MPEYENGEVPPRLIILFPDNETRSQFCAEKGVKVRLVGGKVWSTRWPYEEKFDADALRFVDDDEC